MSTVLLNAGLGLLPVLAFLATLLQSDSFKLVRPRFVLVLLGLGAFAALAAYIAGVAVMNGMGIDAADFRLFGGPLLEEALKASIIVCLIRLNRIGFAFDAAIAGFSVGTGFAIVENYFYLQVLGANQPALWVFRGFGAAIMHGGAAALFAIGAHFMHIRYPAAGPLVFIPGFATATVLHAAFNRYIEFPVTATIFVLVGFASALALVLKRDRRTIERWVEADFDRQRRLLDEIRLHKCGAHALGRMLASLQNRFPKAAADDFIRYVELHLELVLHAEALIAARSLSPSAELGEPIKEKIEEFREVGKRIGPTARHALGRHLQFTRQAIFKLYMLDPGPRTPQSGGALGCPATPGD